MAFLKPTKILQNIPAIVIFHCVLFSTSTVYGKTIRNTDKACHSIFTQAIDYFATKTPYINKSLSNVTPEGCTPLSIWMMNRHGTRLPGDDNILDMLYVLPILREEIVNASLNNRGELCEQEKSRIEAWTPDLSLNVTQKSYLTEQGRIELFGIGKKFQQQFPNLLTKNFSNESYYFRSTEEERAIESGKEFASAIFGRENLNTVYFPTPVEGDPILHFYKNCQKWIEEVDENPEAKLESNRFIESVVYQSILLSIQKRLGIERQLTTSDVQLMYDACRYETAWNVEIYSPWCGIFTESELEVLEYSEDLEDFYMDGYPYSITYEQACTPIKEILDIFNARINGNSNESSRLFTGSFGHSATLVATSDLIILLNPPTGTLLKFYARLGLFRDSHNLTSDSFEEESDRKWRSTKIGSFASNIALILFNCPNELDQYQIGTLVSEEKVPVPACNGNWICSYDQFRRHFQNIADTCDLDAICKI